MRLSGIVCASFVMCSTSALLFGQTPAKPKPAFEVASIKASAPLSTLIAQRVRFGMTISGARFDCRMSLNDLTRLPRDFEEFQSKAEEVVDLDE